MECIGTEKKSEKIERDKIMNRQFSSHDKYDYIHRSEVDKIGIEGDIRCPDIILSDDKRREVGSENTDRENDL